MDKFLLQETWLTQYAALLPQINYGLQASDMFGIALMQLVIAIKSWMIFFSAYCF